MNEITDSTASGRRPNPLFTASLSWTSPFTGLVLLLCGPRAARASIAYTTHWNAAVETIVTDGSNYQATIQTTHGPRIFRLQHP